MEKLVFECETITPMFLGGADGNAELRPPSIKAALRFWWRALHGGLPLDQLKRQEAEIFGGSGDNEGKSKFSIRIMTDKVPNSSKDIKSKLWDTQNKKLKTDSEGIGYFLYPFLIKDREYYINQKFTIVFASFEKNILIEISKVFSLFIWLGSLGSRSRRGCGNITVNSYNCSFDLEIFNPILNGFSTKEDLKKHLESIISSYYIKSAGVNNSYSNLSNLKLYILDPENDYHKALNKIGENYKKFRSYKQPDYNTVKNFIQTGNITQPIEKAAFGLPLEYRYRSLIGSNAHIEGSDNNRQRSASPIIFKVLKVKSNNNNLFYPIVLLFERKLLPDADNIKIKGTKINADKTKTKRIPKFVSQPNNTILSTFITQLPNNVEVII